MSSGDDALCQSSMEPPMSPKPLCLPQVCSSASFYTLTPNCCGLLLIFRQAIPRRSVSLLMALVFSITVVTMGWLYDMKQRRFIFGLYLVLFLFVLLLYPLLRFSFLEQRTRKGTKGLFSLCFHAMTCMHAGHHVELK
ncbi:hypothetical protein BS50DRAFT_165947 [Corynespora cassiicola Philippines]|uniref:Uncharacterized protein n=1 Tax=Corynespora cassiicola Philippines TaxID=1448308 RepID=A0A2T2P549_CORCC|nr:hypothetical protein BS50DRAFT_165947 [Corynespora cassiicola Philippines]